MQDSDDAILRKIKQLFELEIRDDNSFTICDNLARLYSELSFSRSYTPQELFPKMSADYKVSKDAISRARKLGLKAQQKWTVDGGEEYVSSRELFRQKTGIDVGREYTYPNGMSPKEFQESFNATQIHKEISNAYTEMAYEALCMHEFTLDDVYDKEVAYMLFLEKEKKGATALLENAYHKFWEANSQISGYEDLKIIRNPSDMHDFLMGVASEIPLDDISAYLNKSHDKKIAAEVAENSFRLRQEFKIEGNPGFEITNKTWDKHVAPALEQKKMPSKAISVHGMQQSY